MIEQVSGRTRVSGRVDNSQRNVRNNGRAIIMDSRCSLVASQKNASSNGIHIVLSAVTPVPEVTCSWRDSTSARTSIEAEGVRRTSCPRHSGAGPVPIGQLGGGKVSSWWSHIDCLTDRWASVYVRKNVGEWVSELDILNTECDRVRRGVLHDLELNVRKQITTGGHRARYRA